MRELHMTRKELYDLAWNESVASISRRLGITANIIRKACKQFNIPLPQNGHWSKLQFGKPVTIIPFPEEGDPEAVIKLALKETDKDKLDNKTHEESNNYIESNPFAALKVPAHLSNPDPLVVKAGEHLKAKDTYRSDGGLVSSGYKGLNIRVSPKNVNRALGFMDTFIKALRNNGYDIKISDETYAVVEGVEFTIKLREKLKREKVKDPKYGWERTDYKATGVLYFNFRHYWHDNTYTDGKLLIEEQLPKIFEKIVILGKAEKEDRIKREEQEKIKLAKEKIQQDFRLKQEKELEEFKSLLKEAKRWHETSILRNYLKAMEELIPSNNNDSEEFNRWLEWSKQKVDWYDPTVKRPDDLLDEVDKETLTLPKKNLYWGFG